MKPLLTILATIAASYGAVASAVYTRTNSGSVDIDSIYANEWGSPFVTFKSQINPACYGGNGLYLYNQEIAQPSKQLQNNKMAMLLSAKLANKKVVLDYFYDGSQGGWSNCYIHGISIVDQ